MYPILHDVLPDYGVATLADLACGLGLRKQYAWLLWRGEVALNLERLRRIHETFGVPVEVLMQVTCATPPKRQGRKPRERLPSTPPKEDV